MKKILIPIIGLFVLILLTPYILGRVANSNIDDKLSNLKSKTIKIEQISKDVSYLYSKRVFKVKIDKSYFEFPIKGDFLVTLTFKNLPITTAKFDVEIKRLKNFRELKGYRFSILTKDLKTFHPSSWMQMGHELLFFWMARMILMSAYVLDEIPFFVISIAKISVLIILSSF